MPLRLSTGKIIRPGHVTGIRRRKTIPVRLFTQQHSRWCWCACCEMILDYFGFPQGQCSIANYGLSLATCCNNPIPVGCNSMIWTIHPALVDIIDTYTHFGCKTTHSASQLTFASLCGEIDVPKNRPIQVCFAWSGGGAHVTIVRGYQEDSAGNQYVYVNESDPSRRSTNTGGLISFTSLKSAYGFGSWAETFTF